MIKIYYLGTCSGTEPMVGMHHCSFILEVNGVLYWFEGGENCAYAAFTMGIDLLKTKALFVSHPHIDHIGGLANLLFTMEKIHGRDGKVLINNNTLEVFFPDMDTFQAIKKIAASGRERKMKYDINEHEIEDGIIFQDENVKVTALHNHHMGTMDTDKGWISFSFLIETDEKKIVFSGDVAKPNELDELINDGVDVLIMETGHHKVNDVCEYAKHKNISDLRFIHHGRSIIERREENEALMSEYALKNGFSIKICYDGMIEKFDF